MGRIEFNWEKNGADTFIEEVDFFKDNLFLMYLVLLNHMKDTSVCKYFFTIIVIKRFLSCKYVQQNKEWFVILYMYEEMNEVLPNIFYLVPKNAVTAVLQLSMVNDCI